MRVLLIGKQGTGKPLFARILRKLMQNKTDVRVHLIDLDMNPLAIKDGLIGVYTLDSDIDLILPFDVPPSFFDLIVFMPNSYEKMYKNIKSFSSYFYDIVKVSMSNLIKEANPR